jgi:hypothetical protein
LFSIEETPIEIKKRITSARKMKGRKRSDYEMDWGGYGYDDPISYSSDEEEEDVGILYLFYCGRERVI